VAALLAVGFLARWPHLPVLLFALVVVPLALWGHIALPLLRVTLSVVVPFIVSIALIQGLFYPGAKTVLLALGPLAFKAEGLVFAYGTGARILLLAGAGLLLLFSTHPGDLLLALVQRGMPNALAYIVMSALQLIPHMQARAATIADAQRARGLETEGSLLARSRALLPLLGPLVFGALADVDERAMALEARAFSAPRPKTSFKALRDTRTQHFARTFMLLAAALAGALEVWSG
jgi:energy-coupling factor transport system permease protein